MSGLVLEPVDGDPFAQAYYGDPMTPAPYTQAELANAAKIGSALAQTPFELARKLAQSAWSAVTLPGDVWEGHVDPLSDEAIARSWDLASLTAGTAPEGLGGWLRPPAPAATKTPVGLRAVARGHPGGCRERACPYGCTA